VTANDCHFTGDLNVDSQESFKIDDVHNLERVSWTYNETTDLVSIASYRAFDTLNEKDYTVEVGEEALVSFAIGDMPVDFDSLNFHAYVKLTPLLEEVVAPVQEETGDEESPEATEE